MSTCRFVVPEYMTRPADPHGSSSADHRGRKDGSGGAQRFVAGPARGGHCQLAPDHLAGIGPARAPPLRDLADHLKAAATFVILAGLPQPGRRGGVIEYLAEQPA